jgi:hypothetical protein
MTPKLKIKREILLQLANERDLCDIIAEGITEENIDTLYDELISRDSHWDFESEFRGGQYETDIPAPSSRHYESKSVAAKCCDGSWVGWTYWYGGGKHGEPKAIDWMCDAYDLEVTEQEKMVLVREFKKL